ncbi:gag-pol polyprotein [Cucumis melo var. makuwa]|uniref:Gag-pol polyprotein n=1 Tax=Cucumis melo var. makuwa TaxID=1194695 RepID=A0A5A7SSB7_CUCMM|nr:gag-pol polyprotein [Cucumis melo var. makuwa]TYK13557.1 gag-pol polyprotein [Cucumis melo var. makuwa]
MHSGRVSSQTPSRRITHAFWGSMKASCKIMEIIREGPSTSRPPVLDSKNYSYWKPCMIFFIKTLDGRAWRALVAGYEPLMITVDGVSVPKPEVDWADA